MVQPALHLLARVLADDDGLGAFAASLPSTSARVSEPALPLFLAALHERRGDSLLCVLPDDEDARDAAEAAAWFTEGASVAFMPSRGVALGSGLQPPPHLVGERARALDVLSQGGLVCVSAAGLVEPLPLPERRPDPVTISPGEGAGLEELVERIVLAGYERVERVEERGQIAVRGGILDVFPTTGRDPVRVELFGDEVEAIRAFSPYTQRALRTLDAVTVYPAAEATEGDEGGDRVPPLRPRARPRLATRRRCRALARARRRAQAERCGDRSAARRPGARVRGAAARARRARARRSRARARLARPQRAARRRHVPPPGRRAPDTEAPAQGRGECRGRADAPVG